MSRPAAAAAGAGCLLLLLGAAGCTGGQRAGAGRGSAAAAGTPTSGSAAATPGGAGPVTATAAVRAVLSRRANAIVGRDRARFLSTVDPALPGAAAGQRRFFTALSGVPFASWSYRLADGSRPPARLTGTGRWTVPVVVRYRIRGFDASPTVQTRRVTFDRRAGRWQVADDRPAGGGSGLPELWDLGPVRVRRSGPVLVLRSATAGGSAVPVPVPTLRSAIPRVDAVWGRGWSRRLVVEVPGGQAQLGRLTGERTGQLTGIAALATAEIHGPDGPVGNRILLNPAAFTRLSPLGRQVVLTHETTHVATRAVTGTGAPSWLVEGFADFVAFRDSGIPVTTAAAELHRRAERGLLPAAPPTDTDFHTPGRVERSYEAAWLTCRYIADRVGTPGLVRFYRLVGPASPDTRATAVVAGLRSVLHTTPGRFLVGWRAYLRRVLR